jgi:hypothetical protein
VSSRACLQTVESTAPAVVGAPACAAAMAAEAAVTDHAQDDRVVSVVEGAGQMPTYSSVLSLVRRVRDDLLSQSMGCMAMPDAKEQHGSCVEGSPPKYALLLACLVFSCSFMPTQVLLKCYE